MRLTPLGAIVLAVIVAVILVQQLHKSSSTTATTTVELVTAGPGSQTVYDRINAETDCGQLQDEFDTADANHGRDDARHAVDLMLIDSSYMDAADKRMRQIGCY